MHKENMNSSKQHLMVVAQNEKLNEYLDFIMQNSCKKNPLAQMHCALRGEQYETTAKFPRSEIQKHCPGEVCTFVCV